MGISRGGICKESPRASNSGRLGVRGATTVLSSFEVWVVSRNLGEGDSWGVLSESERVFCNFCGVVIDG